MKTSEQVPKVPYDLNQKLLTWKSLALMAFMTVWGFGNVINGYGYFHGIQVGFSWILVFALYFVPYSLMVGELGSTFKTKGGGVSSWIDATFNKKLAYYAGWTYWVVHMPYIAQKPLNTVIAASWAIWGSPKATEEFKIEYVQIVCILIFLVVVFLTLRGVRVLKSITSLAGFAGLVMSFLFILMAVSAPIFLGDKVQINHIPLNSNSLIPTFNFEYITSLSVLIFAVGGCEKISPYVNKTKDPGKGFPRGIIFMTSMVVLAALLGTFALALMFDPTNPDKDFIANGAYKAFRILGDWYGVGNLFVVIYALSILISQVAVMILSIDAPLRMLIESSDSQFIPKSLYKQNKHGSYVNGVYMVTVIVLILLIIPTFGIEGVQDMVKWLIKLNSVCMPIRYLWVFLAYWGLKKMVAKERAEYTFTKSTVLGKLMGGWCFFITAACCLLGMYSDDTFKLVMNIVTPIVLVLLGLILPQIARRQNK